VQVLANPVVAAATAANYGRLQEMPCVLNTPSPWLGGKMNLIIKGSPALLGTSKCLCANAGLIEITDPGQSTVKEGGPMNVTVRDASGSVVSEHRIEQQEPETVNSLAPQSVAPNGLTSGGMALQQGTNSSSASANDPASSSSSAAASTQSTLSVRKVEGAAKTYPRQKIVYKVTEYIKDISKMNAEDKEKVKETKWAVKIDNDIIKLEDKKGGKITLDIDKDWEGKDIFVMAYIEDTEKAVQKTKVLQDQSTSVLIRGVVGEDEAFVGREVKYEVTNSNKDRDAGKIGNDSIIKWKINADGKDITLLGKKGERSITLKIKPEWAGQEIIVMPHFKTPTETVSVKTRVEKLNLPKILVETRQIEGKDEHGNIARDMHFGFKSASGHINKIEEIKHDMEKPQYSTFDDKLNGLTIAINDTWGHRARIMDYEYDASSKKFKSKLEITIFDHFGLDENDIETYGTAELVSQSIWESLEQAVRNKLS
jgi:hypothetical protein